jgi:hypothetical protein
MKRKTKVTLTKMNTEIGYIPVLSNFQTVNRPLNIFAAYRTINNCNESIFFIVRPKDAAKLAEIGFNIAATELKPGFYPKFFGSYIEQSII